VSSMVAEVIAKFGTPAQQQAYVPRLVSGEFAGGSFALSEPACGSDPGSMTTRAQRQGDSWIINGEKMWITTGDQAGVHIVWARSSGPGTKGISCFLVDKDTPGLTAGKPEEKMGLLASHTVALSFADVRVPHSAMLGQEGQGFKIAMTALDGGRLGVASQALGIGTAALELAKAYVQKPRPTGKPLADQQGIQFKLADMATELDAGFLLNLRAAWRKEKGLSFTREAAMAKVFATESSNRAVRQAVQILGSDGTLEENGVARLFRDCRVTQIYEGTSEIQRLVIAREELR
jgi:alkylation response protein AidB-like acyl-CoA dehydrogenase